jgi:hypothetical protein
MPIDYSEVTTMMMPDLRTFFGGGDCDLGSGEESLSIRLTYGVEQRTKIPMDHGSLGRA